MMNEECLFFSRKPPNNREIVALTNNYNILQLLMVKADRLVKDTWILKEGS